MKKSKKFFTDSEAAAIKLLGAAIMRNAEAVSKRYRRSLKGVDACYAVARLGEALIQAADYDQPFRVVLEAQAELELDWGDEENYAEFE